MDITLCRACLRCKGQKSLLDSCKGEMLITYFYECTGLDIKPGDTSIPHLMCETCLKKLEEFYSFRLLCIESDNVIKNYSETDESSDENSDVNDKEIRPLYDNKSTQLVEGDIKDDGKFVSENEEPSPKQICEVCGYCAEDSHTLKLHHSTHKIKRDRVHLCDLCPSKFSSIASLKSHRFRHNHLNLYMCEECGMRFSASAPLKEHQVSVHSGLRPFKCALCPKAFALRSNFVVHQKIHAGIKPHKCQTCSKSFTTTSDLKGHMLRVHSGQRPFSCDACPRAYAVLSDLNTHKRTHYSHHRTLNGVARHECPQCGKRLTNKASLRSHLRIHSGERPYVCNICSSSFAHYTSFKSHKVVHTGTRNFPCPKCDKRFSRSNVLRKHMKLQHESPNAVKKELDHHKSHRKNTLVFIKKEIENNSQTSMCLIEETDLDHIEVG